VNRRLLAEIAAASLVTGLIVALAWWWNRPSPPYIQDFQCASPVEIVTPNGRALWCGDDQLPSLLDRFGVADCEARIRETTEEGTPLRLVLAENCTVKEKLTSLSPTVLASLGEPLNLNSATANDLTILEGIGPKLASAIVADRTANGDFCSIDEVGRVKGIGPHKIESLRQSGAVASCAP
jgi:competence ComEA-like helix-hairpin-helix protein